MSGLIGTSHSKSKVIGRSQDTASAWVLFNGTGTIAIRKSFNVSALIDHNTGQYGITFTSAIADTNAVIVGNAERQNQQGENFVPVAGNTTTTGCLFYCREDDGDWLDSPYCHVMVFN